MRDRFTPDMLLRYCAALGLRPWDDDFYPGPCVLLTSPIQPLPDAYVVTIPEAQRLNGIVVTGNQPPG